MPNFFASSTNSSGDILCSAFKSIDAGAPVVAALSAALVSGVADPPSALALVAGSPTPDTPSGLPTPATDSPSICPSKTPPLQSTGAPAHCSRLRDLLALLFPR